MPHCRLARVAQWVHRKQGMVGRLDWLVVDDPLAWRGHEHRYLSKPRDRDVETGYQFLNKDIDLAEGVGAHPAQPYVPLNVRIRELTPKHVEHIRLVLLPSQLLLIRLIRLNRHIDVLVIWARFMAQSKDGLIRRTAIRLFLGRHAVSLILASKREPWANPGQTKGLEGERPPSPCFDGCGGWI